MKKLSLFTLLLALFVTWSHAQTYNMTISGTVTNINGGAPVPNWPVQVAIDSNGFFGFSYYNTVTTDINGYYSDVVAVPGSINQGSGWTGLRDCTPSGYPTNSFTFTSGTSAIPNLDFQICTTTTTGGCSAAFAANWVQGTTLVHFNDASTSSNGNITSWYWDFGSSTSTQQNPSFAFNSMGMHVVCLTIVTDSGCTDTHCDSVNVGGMTSNCYSNVTAQTSPQGVTTVSATGSGTGTIVNYFYDFGDGTTLSSSSSSENHVYTANGVYTACVDILFSDSCISRSCVNITIGGAFGCQAGFYWYPDTTGQYSIIVVNTSSGINPTYSWSFGDGSGSTQAYPQHTYSGPGTYIVCVTVTDTLSNCTNTYCDSLVVVNKVSAPFTINVVASGATVVTPSTPSAFAVSLYPNPARDYLQVNLTLEQAAPVSVSLIDLSGRTVAVENVGDLSEGRHGIRLQTQDLPAGLYLARIQAGGKLSSHKVMVAH